MMRDRDGQQPLAAGEAGDSPVVFFEPREGPLLYRFRLLDACSRVVHACTTRCGGVSPQPWGTLNVGSTTHDEATHVRENRRRVEAACGLRLAEWVHLEHGAEVREVTSWSDCADTVPGLPRADAVITRVRGLPLTIFTADCVPVVLVDPVTPALGVVHAGWRGTVAEVTARTVTAMERAFGTRPADLLVAVGASIGPCCMEVGDDVRTAVASRFPLWQETVVQSQKGGKTTIDLWELNVLQLEARGVPREQVAVSRLCTSCRADLFYSWRRDHGETGRLAMVASLTD